MNFLDNMPYFDNFFLDGLVLLLGIGFLVIATYVVLMVGSLCKAVLQSLWSKLAKNNKDDKRNDVTQVVFLRKEPKPNKDE